MDGVLLIDKPAGITSAAVVRRIKARVKPARVGHLGTLDPSATGLLPILIGEATKLAPFLGGGDKEYSGLIRLGAETDTLDSEGKVVRTAEVPALDEARLAEVAAYFTGEIEQTPPLYSAIKRHGVPLYKLARKGQEVVPPESRRITISRLVLEAASADSIRFIAVCSPGTYARALARDIGIALGSAAYLEELRRLRNGIFSIADAISIDDALTALESGGGKPRMIGLREALPAMPEAEIDPALERRLRNGDARALDGLAPPGAKLFKVVSHDGCLVAIAEATSQVTAAIVRVFTA